jgi:hypothetical protein
VLTVPSVDPERLQDPLHAQPGQFGSSWQTGETGNTKPRRAPATACRVCTPAFCPSAAVVAFTTSATPLRELVTTGPPFQHFGTWSRIKKKKKEKPASGLDISRIPRVFPRPKNVAPASRCLLLRPHGQESSGGQAAGGHRRRYKRDPLWQRASQDLGKGLSPIPNTPPFFEAAFLAWILTRRPVAVGFQSPTTASNITTGGPENASRRHTKHRPWLPH